MSAFREITLRPMHSITTETRLEILLSGGVYNLWTTISHTASDYFPGRYTVMTSETFSRSLDAPCVPTLGLQHDNFIFKSDENST